MLNKILYVITRDIGVFSVPGLRYWRNRVYAAHLGAKAINVDRGVRIQPLHRRLESTNLIGESLHVGAHCLIDLSGNVRIGARVTLSEGAKVFTHSHPIDGGPQDWRQNSICFGQIDIGDDVWIGAHAIILSSVKKIGAGAIIAAGSIVSHDVAANTVVAGVPAKYIRNRRLDG